MGKGALAGPGGANDQHLLPFVYTQGYSAQRRLLLSAVGEAEIRKFNNRFTHN
ncbi:hypothetical protein D3C73_1602730 [compost metagenome]